MSKNDDKFQRFLRGIILATVATCSGLVLVGIFSYNKGLIPVGACGLALFLVLFLLSMGRRNRGR